MGEVSRARDTKLNRDVALKVLAAEVADNVERLARFRREAQILASLNHPHIAHIYGLEESDGVVALVLELVEGPTLADRIAQGPIPIDEALPIARQIAEALEAAHEQGIIHRDLKPANIKIRADGMVKVLDFGLAKAMEPSAGPSPSVSLPPTITTPAMTAAGMILGTAAYMSPEQARGKTLDRRTDMWAFGCVLYEMLTARRAFGGEDVSDTLAFVITKDVDWSLLPRDTPAAIRRLLRRCLDKDRNVRLRDAGDAILELAEASAGSSVAPSSVAVVRKPWSALAVGAVGVLLGAVVATATFAVLRRSAEPERRQIRRINVTLPELTPMPMPGSGAARNLAVAPDGTRFAFVGPSNHLYLWSAEQLNAVPLYVAGSVRDLFFSPDGQWIGFFQSGSNSLNKISVNGGPAQTLSGAISSSRGATWSSDGSIIFATTDVKTGLLRTVDTGGTAAVLTTPDPRQQEVDHLWPELLPGGKAVLYTILRPGPIGNADIAVLNLATGVNKVILRGGAHAQFVPTGHLIFNSSGIVRAIAFDPVALEVHGDSRPLVEQMLTSPNGAVSAAFAKDGTLVYFPGSLPDRLLMWVDRQGHEESLGAEPRPYAVPRSSPDGTRVAAHLENVENPDVVVFDLARRTMSRLTFGVTPSIRPTWTPDSRWVLFRSDTNGGNSIDRRAADGSGQAERLTPVVGDGSPHTVSPDGRTLVFAQVDPTTGRDLWRVDLVGDRTPQPLVVEPGGQSNAVISPDGRWLAYHSEDAGAVTVRPFPNVSAGRWDVVSNGAKWPLWSHNGRELFFVTAQGIESVTVDSTQAGFRWTSPRVVVPTMYANFPGLGGPRNYDLSADGTRFLVIKAAETEGRNTSFVLVQNWFEELRTPGPNRP
jgi:eukaryotic-like serine/threonine-protein kinase